MNTFISKNNVREGQSAIMNAVSKELANQLEAWGIQDHEPEKWLTILMEEVGEVAALELDGHPGIRDYEQISLNYREELIQVAAVAIAAAESWDRS